MAFFQHVGNTPFESERLNKRERGTYIDRTQSFKILLLILSCPAALHVFKSLSIFKTSLELILRLLSLVSVMDVKSRSELSPSESV